MDGEDLGDGLFMDVTDLGVTYRMGDKEFNVYGEQDFGEADLGDQQFFYMLDEETDKVQFFSDEDMKNMVFEVDAADDAAWQALARRLLTSGV